MKTENDVSKEKYANSLLSRLNMRTVPFIPEINEIARGGDSAGLIAELEYEFGKNPQGFYLFYERQPNNPNYKKGESWKEKVHLPVSKIKRDFGRIGIRYNSLKEFKAAKDVKDEFKGKYYCSIYDNKQERAFYLRNHAMVDKVVRSVLGDLTVLQIYEACNKDTEVKREQITKDIEQGNIKEPLSSWEAFVMCNTFLYPDKLQKEVA